MGLSSQLRGGSSRSQQRNDLVEAFRTSLVSLHFCGFTRWFVVAGWLQTKIMASQPTTPPLRNCNPPQEIAAFFIRRPYSWGGVEGDQSWRPAWQSVPLGGGRVASGHYFCGIQTRWWSSTHSANNWPHHPRAWWLSLRIQICPKKGINLTILLWGWDWEHQTYSREGMRGVWIQDLLPFFIEKNWQFVHLRVAGWLRCQKGMQKEGPVLPYGTVL